MAWSEWKKFGVELVTQTKTQSLTFSGSGAQVAYSLTFDELTEIVGIVNLTTNDASVVFMGDSSRKPTIDGNIIKGTCRENDNSSETITLSITAIGYAK